MKPLFTIHAGEFLVASYIEQKFKDYLVWLPSRDSGVDLLLTDKHCKKAVSIQVKFSRDFLMTHMADALRPGLKACGWFTLNPKKLSQSTATFWIFVLYPFNQRELDFVIIPPSAALDMFSSLHGRQKNIQSYIWVTKKKRCWEATSSASSTRISRQKDSRKPDSFLRSLHGYPNAMRHARCSGGRQLRPFRPSLLHPDAMHFGIR